MKHIREASLILTSILLMSCGSISNDSSSQLGYSSQLSYLRQNVVGLEYKTKNGASGITEESGVFKHYSTPLKSDVITFSIGNVVIGEVPAKRILTFVDFKTKNSSIRSAVIQNITRFLMMLDSDGNSKNGIKIEEKIREIALNWPKVNFDTNELSFNENVKEIIKDVNKIYNIDVRLPSAEDAKNYLESVIRCNYSGVYIGGYTGVNNNKIRVNGDIGFFVDPKNGSVNGYVKNRLYRNLYEINSNKPISFSSNNLGYVGGSGQGKIAWQGILTNASEAVGSWTDEGDDWNASGNFEGRKITVNNDAHYQFSGKYSENLAKKSRKNASLTAKTGFYHFDVDKNKIVSGVLYSANDNSIHTFAGKINKNSLRARGDNGLEISGTIDLKNKTITNGKWKYAHYSGKLTGTGCKVN